LPAASGWSKTAQPKAGRFAGAAWTQQKPRPPLVQKMIEQAERFAFLATKIVVTVNVASHAVKHR
jgi:hypothetical protein